VSSDRRANAVSLKGLRYHLPLLVGVAVCVYAGWFELSRAREGHTIAWVYAFEWPGFAVVGIYLWWRTITSTEDAGDGDRTTTSHEHPLMAADDPGLVAWRQYLADTERADRARDLERDLGAAD
jgi:hypothetical protein